MDEQADVTITVLTAAAGYGKTSLLAEWVSRRGAGDTAWICLDSDDNDDRRFWSAVLDALSSCPAVPDDSPLPRLAVPPNPSSAPRFLAEVVNGLDALPEPVWLILDDAHELTDPQPLHGLEVLLRHSPAGLRLVMSARHEPLLPLGRLRLTDQFTEIGADELRFSRGEAAELFAAAGVELDRHQLDQVLDQTDGWVAALRFAALALSGDAEPGRQLDDLLTGDPAVAEYLTDEVLSCLPSRMCGVLATVSVCDQVSVELAVELSGQADAGAVLDSLTRRTSLVGRIEPDSYQVHAMLRAHVRADLGRRAPDRLAELHRTAARWFVRREEAAPALWHAGRSGDAELVTAIGHRYGVGLVLSGDHGLVREMLGVVGAQLVAEDSMLALVSALLHLESVETELADRDLRGAETAWPADPTPELVALHRLVRSRRAQVGGTVDDLLRATEQLDDSSDGDARFAALSWLHRGTALLWVGRVPAAREHFDAAFRTAHGGGHEYVEAQCLTAFSGLAAAEGDFDLMVKLANEVQDRQARHGWGHTMEAAAVSGLLGYGALLSAEPHRCLSETAEAGRLADGGDPLLNRNLSLLVETLRGAAEFELGNWTSGARRILRARQAAGDARFSIHQVALSATLGHRAALLLGWSDAAGQFLRWAESVVPDSGEIHLMRARGQLTIGRHEAASKIIRPVLDGTTPVLLRWLEIEAWLLDSEAALSADATDRARHSLKNGLAAAQRIGVEFPVVFARPAIVELMTGQLDNLGATSRFARRVLATREELALPSMPVPLTPSERGILLLLRTFRSLDEIAGDLMVSPNTVKTHVRSIYTKLGVTKRGDAVETAAHRGLLDSETAPA